VALKLIYQHNALLRSCTVRWTDFFPEKIIFQGVKNRCPKTVSHDSILGHAHLDRSHPYQHDAVEPWLVGKYKTKVSLYAKQNHSSTRSANSRMAPPTSLYLFGDQTTQCKDDLAALLLLGGNPTLNTFIDQAASSLRQEIQSLSWSHRDQFPSFSNFLDLLAIDASKPLHPALQLALSSVHHFALFLW